MRPPAIRPATLADAPAMADTVAEGFETYREWAPRGWDPPPRSLQLAGIRDRLPSPGCVCLLVEDTSVRGAAEPAAEDAAAPAGASAASPSGIVVGQVAYVPAREEAGVAHVWMLFVRRVAWGSGIASALLAAGVEAATAEGYARMRLHTPAEHRRARAFYEREGWSAAAAPFYEPMLGLTLVTYRRDL